MPLELLSEISEKHPVTSIDYPLVTKKVSVDAVDIDLVTVANVEKAIDLVFEWLESSGRNPQEIETLAPYFGAIWPSAIALAGYLSQPRMMNRMKGKKIFEIGCGLGLPSIVASKLGANVTATDNHPDVPRFLEMNIKRNEPCHVHFRPMPLDGGGLDLTLGKEQFDMVVASDVLYEQRLVDEIATMIDVNVRRDGVVVVSDPGRPYIQPFANAMFGKGWNYQLQPWTVNFEGKASDIFLLVFSRS